MKVEPITYLEQVQIREGQRQKRLLRNAAIRELRNGYNALHRAEKVLSDVLPAYVPPVEYLALSIEMTIKALQAYLVPVHVESHPRAKEAHLNAMAVIRRLP